MTGSTSAVPLVELASNIVAAFVAKNALPQGELPGLLQAVHASLVKLSVSSAPSAEKAMELSSDRAQPSVPIKKSITPDYLICLEDGRRFKSLKRHLRNLGLTPEQYRAKWNLPTDYPMVAPNYAAARSALAKSMGLGQKARERRRAPKAGQQPHE